jgi:choline dehydrogenase-like flavoprotein
MIFENIEQFRAAGFKPRVGIVGGGPAGITIAHKLAQAKIPSVIFEAGGAEYTEESQDFYRGKVVGDPYFDLEVSRLRFLGGSSNHWAGWCRILEAHDFLPKPYVPHSGWPITRADIEPFLPETFGILGIQPFRPDLPISPDMSWYEVIKSDHVHFGEKFYPELETNPYIAVVLNTEVSELSGNGRIVTSAKLWSAGAPAGELALDYYVACTGGLENSRLLLWSNEQSNGGVVPNAAALGRYWMEHPMYTAGAAIFTDETAVEFDAAGDAFFAPTPAAVAQRGILNFHIQVSTMPYPGMKQYVADLACLTPEWTEWISEELGSHLRCSSQVHISLEEEPRPDNRIVLSRTDRDLSGIPRIELHWTKGPLDRRTLVEGMRLFGETIAVKDIGRLKIEDWVLDGSPYPVDGQELAGHHHMGGTRMGTDPAFSVVDADCKVHGMENLFVGGSSVFASSGQCTPTTTLTALAVRLGDHLSRIITAKA